MTLTATEVPAGQRLTGEQTLAAAAPEPAVFIEAAPGSGKTTVAAERFGYLRYRAPADPRGVIGVSFTRAATRELRRRILRTWGPGALHGPHRVVTIDTLLLELLHHLLERGEVSWPQKRTALTVLDAWNTALEHRYTDWQQTLVLSGRTIVHGQFHVAEPKRRITAGPYWENIYGGTCTHDDVRAVMTAVLADTHLAAIIGEHLAATMRSILVDEVFDANHLDLKLLGLVRRYGISVTAIGDPWQALYEWRGASPRLITASVAEHRMRTYRLTRSFRFRSQQVVELTCDLRDRRPVQVPPRDGTRLDVILAHWWKTLWTAGGDVLPLGFTTPTTVEMAAATLLLDLVTRAVFGQPAVFAEAALQLLGVTDQDARDRLQSRLVPVLDALRYSTVGRPTDLAWHELVKAVGSESRCEFDPVQDLHTEPLGWLGNFLRRDVAAPVPGLTVHQAKGREWDAVGVRLTGPEKTALSRGLDPLNGDHRALYVALTRATSAIVQV